GGLRHGLGPGAPIDVVAFPIPQRAFPSIFDMFSGRKPPPPPTAAAITAAGARAVPAANRADLVMAVLGESPAMSGEAASRATLDIPDGQQRLLEAVTRSGK